MRALKALGERLPAVALPLGIVALAGLVVAGPACVSRRPNDLDDLCRVFEQRRSWHGAAEKSFERWGIPASVQLAIVHQESGFRARARPPRRRILGVLPGPRLSSAYGYAQAKEGTWDDYRRKTGRGGADRDDFDDAVDFIGWYGDQIHRLTGIAKSDPRRIYLAYHEGPTGFRRGSYREKPWLLGVAAKVEQRAQRYERQYAGCRESLKKRRFWIF